MPRWESVGLVERFSRAYVVNPDTGCWIWRTSPLKRRYGSFWMDGRREQAHRASWIIFKGSIPEGIHVLHKCDVTMCVNPGHLFLGTHADNMADMKQKGRAEAPRGDDHWTRVSPEKLSRGENHKWHGIRRTGSNNPNARLTEDDVVRIKSRIRRGDTDSDIAKDFNVRPGAIWFIRTEKHWRHVA